MYSVIVGNVGEVYYGPDETAAHGLFRSYIQYSMDGYGRVAGESVTLMLDNNPIDEFIGPNDSNLHD